MPRVLSESLIPDTFTTCWRTSGCTSACCSNLVLWPDRRPASYPSSVAAVRALNFLNQRKKNYLEKYLLIGNASSTKGIPFPNTVLTFGCGQGTGETK